MSIIPEDRKVDANPNRRFFVSMLIKDIELVPAIIDLVDNSVDAARAHRKNNRMAGMSVQIDAGPDRFSIIDTCGGIEADDARNYAFRFGRASDYQGMDSSVGQFGIGMKRALFKLGAYFTVISIAKNSSFSLSVDVDDWVQDNRPDWTFTLSQVDETKGGPAAKRGTEIEVTSLHPSVADDFRKSNVLGQLRSQVAMKHQAALSEGLDIKVNGRKLVAHEPKLLSSTRIKPVKEVISIEVGAEAIEVEFIAGIAAPAGRADARKDDSDATQFTHTGPAGWYIYCNDRMVIAADKSAMTGWGSAGATYHPQYRRFRGYVYMRAHKSELLPWNTTKTGLDQDSRVFRQVQQEMFRLLQMVQSILNREKDERAASDEVPPITAALDTADEVPIAKLRPSAAFVAPPPTPKQRRAPSKFVSVQYDAPRESLERAMELLNVDSARRAGLGALEYFLNAEG